jgi:hypothetical protein
MGAEPDATHIVKGPTGGPSIAVLTFVDEEEEADDEDERTTFLTTAGLSRRETGGPGGSELVLCVSGEVDAEDLSALVEQLGELAQTLVSGEGEVAPGARIYTSPLAVFEDMSVLLLARWGAEGETLEGTDPPIRLLSANPLYEDEALAIDGMDEEQALAWLDEQGVDVDDPLRPPAVVAPPPAFTEALAAFASGRSFDITQAMQDVVKGMETWIRENAPELQPGEGAEASHEARDEQPSKPKQGS